MHEAIALQTRPEFVLPPRRTKPPHSPRVARTARAESGPSREALFPTVPTFREAGLADAESAGWVGVFAPPGTPPEVADRLSAVVVEVVRVPSVKSDLEALGFQVAGTSRQEFDKTVANDRSRYAKIVAASGMKLE